MLVQHQHHLLNIWANSKQITSPFHWHLSFKARLKVCLHYDKNAAFLRYASWFYEPENFFIRDKMANTNAKMQRIHCSVNKPLLQKYSSKGNCEELKYLSLNLVTQSLAAHCLLPPSLPLPSHTIRYRIFSTHRHLDNNRPLILPPHAAPFLALICLIFCCGWWHN